MHEWIDLETTREKKVAFVAASHYYVLFLAVNFTWPCGSFLFFSQSPPIVDLVLLAIQSNFVLKIRIDEDLMEKRKKDER